MKGKAMIVFIILMMVVNTAPYVQAANTQPLSNTITGIVYDSAGKPVKGAIVVVSYEGDSARSHHVTTDYKGRYRVANIEDGELYINALPPVGDSIHTGSIVTGMWFRSGEIVKNMKLQKVDFTGKLTDSAYNILPGRRLAIYRAQSSFVPIIPLEHLISNKEGNFTIGGLVKGEQYEVYIEDPATGYLQKDYTFTYTGAPLKENLVWQDHFLGIRTVDETGKNFILNNSSITLVEQDSQHTIQPAIDKNPRRPFTIFEDLIPGRTYKIIFKMNANPLLFLDKEYVVTFDPSASHLLRVTIIQKENQITDTIVDEQGNHIENARVRIIDNENRNIISTIYSNFNGSISINDLVEGKSYQIVVDPPLAGNKPSKYIFIPAETITYTSDMKRLPNHTLYNVQIRGKLVDSAGEMLKGISYVLLDQNKKEVSYWNSTYNDSLYQLGNMKEGETYTLTIRTMLKSTSSKSATFVYHSGMEGPNFVYRPYNGNL